MTPKEPKTTHTPTRHHEHTGGREESSSNKHHHLDVKDEVVETTKTGNAKKEKELLMDEGLQAIYGDESMQFDKLDRRNNRTTRILFSVVIILAIMATVSWAGFFVYSYFFAVGHDDTFTLDITMEEELASGQTTQIELHYANPTNVPIAALELDLNLPSTFRVYSFSEDPTNLDDLIWEIGSVPGMTDRVLTINGVWIAQAPSETPVQAYATYKPANFNSNFEDIAVVYVTTLGSLLTTEIIGPEDAQAGETLEYTITVTNTGEEAFENTRLDLTLPEGFYLQESDPAIEAGAPAKWDVAYLGAGESTDITFSGVFASNIENFQYFDASLLLITVDNRGIEQATARTYTDVQHNDISVQLVANGATGSTSVGVGENLRMSIGLENTLEEPIEDLSILLDFQSNDSVPIIWNQATLDGGTVTRDGIVWSLDSIEPGEKVLFNISFPIDASLGVGDADQFMVVASITYNGRTMFASPMTISINSEADLRASVRYYDENGAILGNGPLPPEVGQTTTLRIVWTIDNALHDLNHVRVTATLPPHVTWAGNASHDLGSINYNSSDSTVTWSLDSLPASLNTVTGSFSVSITPDADDVGTFVKLISGSSLSATDAVTSQTLTDSTDSLSSDLDGDLYASVEGGLVVE